MYRLWSAFSDGKSLETKAVFTSLMRGAKHPLANKFKEINLMKKTTAFFAATLLVTLSACGSKSDSKNSNQASTAQGENAKAATGEIPKVKYVAAVIFEGGKGETWNDPKNAKHTPLWRVYICLEQTAQLKTGQVILDFDKLGTPPIQSLWLDEAGQTVLTEQLNSVVVNYKYTAKLTNDAYSDRTKVAYGSANITTKSKQSWEVVSSAPGLPTKHDPENDTETFDLETSEGSLTTHKQSKFDSNGETFYVSTDFTRFTSVEGEQAHTIDACEKANQAVVVQTGDAVTPAQ
jgi:hypothetical protein